jgi:hypothetical protein
MLRIASVAAASDLGIGVPRAITASSSGRLFRRKDGLGRVA